jgi:hypothetical protein
MGMQLHSSLRKVVGLIPSEVIGPGGRLVSNTEIVMKGT